MKQAMIFAAGLGTRLKPLTDTMPKALVRVGVQPLLWHVVQKLKAAGYERIVVNVHHFAQQIVDYLKAQDNFGLDIRISDESDQLLETGGGIKKALPLFDPTEPILIHNVDILSNLDLTGGLSPVCEVHGDCPPVSSASTPASNSASTPIALLIVSRRQTKRYLLFDDTMRLQGWTNIETGEVRGPAANCQLSARPEGALSSERTVRSAMPLCSAKNCQLEKLAFSGLHILYPSAFPLLSEWPDRFPIMDFYLKACADHVIRGYEATDLRLLDVGKLDTLEEANDLLFTI
jgi:hypothetical protein